jgi:hypothetical protein
LNIWNPAMLAGLFCFFHILHICPGTMYGQTVLSGATPLAGLQKGLPGGMSSWSDMFLDLFRDRWAQLRAVHPSGCGSFALYGCGELEDHGSCVAGEALSVC